MSVNRVILVGRLGKEPAKQVTKSGVVVANLVLATNNISYDKLGDKKESTEWHQVSVFGRQAEIVIQYLTTGNQVYVEGRLQTKKYIDREGIERYRTSIVAEQFRMLGAKSNSSQEAGKVDCPF